MTQTTLKRMRKAALQIPDELERNRALFAYHEEAYNFWENQWGGTANDDELAESEQKKHGKMRDHYWSLIKKAR